MPSIITSDTPHDSVRRTLGGGHLWADKYAPKKVSDMCYPLYANRLKAWIQNWTSSIKLDPKAKRGALLSGPPGVGKTTAAHLVAKDLGATIIEYNASDFRSKKSLQEQVSNIINNTIFGTATCILLMDEVDGCDIGGVSEVINMIKHTKIPILCTCNDRWHQKLRQLMNYVEDFKFSRPPCNIAADYICKNVLAYENISLPQELLKEIIQKEGGDIRSVLTNLQVWCLNRKVLDGKTLASAASKSFKNTNVSIFDAAEGFLLGSTNRTFEELQRLYYSADLVDLFVQENYLHFSPIDSNQDIWFQSVVRAARDISEGDKIQRMIYNEQNWSMSNTHLLMSSVLPSKSVKGRYNTFLTGPAANFDRQRPIKFPSWLGNNSTAGKNSRLLALVSKEATHPKSGLSGTATDVVLDYIPLGLCTALTKPLSTSEICGNPSDEMKKEAVAKSINVFDSYHLVRDDWDFLCSVGRFKTLGSYPEDHSIPHLRGASHIPKYEDAIPTAVKSMLTREFNKTHKMDSAVRSIGKAAAATSSRGMGETQMGDEEEEEDPVEETGITLAVKPKKSTPGKRVPKAPSAPTEGVNLTRSKITGKKRSASSIAAD